jgi:hypothetical protein
MKQQQESNHQDSWSQYSKLPAPKIQWRRHDANGNRFYFGNDDGQVATGTGITTVLGKFGSSPFIQAWKDDNINWRELLDMYSGYGTLLHIALSELAEFGTVDPNLAVVAGERWNKRLDFQKDILSIRKFFIDYNVKTLFIEGILGKSYETPKGKVYVCSAIDLFCEMDYISKEKVLVPDGFYKRASGENDKGDIKYKEVTQEKVSRVYAVVDLKSNFQNKDSKSFFESNFQQLIFGRNLIAEEYGELLGIAESDIKIFNLSTLGWTEEPKYLLKEWNIKENGAGFMPDWVLQRQIQMLVELDRIRPKGKILTIGDITIDRADYEFLTFEEYAKKKLEL